MHIPANELKHKIAIAGTKVIIGGKYVHYKNPDKTYTVTNIAITESDDQLCVIYRADYDPELIFVRPLDNWLENVEYHGKDLPRFRIVS